MQLQLNFCATDPLVLFSDSQMKTGSRSVMGFLILADV
ncbi:hypothetical protein SLEP1_g53924 [Rubroshorea leprosula]|uniref:Uncharacterized protein n=1 Tax=Rubroshorea leprosula TaxID=152421 RepID=A0AAV5MB78_9ROSI|nr:hypothetical protein SLEP1_g53924 [Rubroshorea leprosula]